MLLCVPHFLCLCLSVFFQSNDKKEKQSIRFTSISQDDTSSNLHRLRTPLLATASKEGFIGRHFILFLEGDSLQLQHQKLLMLGLQLVVESGLHITLLRSSLRLIETQRRTNLLSTGVAGRLQSYKLWTTPAHDSTRCFMLKTCAFLILNTYLRLGNQCAESNMC
ncbi:unnamed protein product [Lactuca saligna]|uniref:Secreted protein n=1 Tax=Lactuca saligna TaxID=75948 RepID=A0AA35ZNV8_LACSI|nr:unnamed protein product [Lactuca saligna]